MRHEQHSTVDAFALAVRERFEAWDSSHILSGCGNKGLVPQPAVVCTRITNDGELLKPGSQRMPPPDDLPFILRQSTQVNRDAESLSNLRLRLVGEPLIELGDIAEVEDFAQDPEWVLATILLLVMVDRCVVCASSVNTPASSTKPTIEVKTLPVKPALLIAERIVAAQEGGQTATETDLDPFHPIMNESA